MLSPINHHIKNYSNDFKTLNPSTNLHYSKSRISKISDKSQKDQLLRLIQINPFKSSDEPKSPSHSKNNLTEIANVKYIPKRLANLPGLSMEMPLKFIGKSSLDCKKLFGENSNINKKYESKNDSKNEKDKEKEKSKSHKQKVINIKGNSFRNEYIYKFSCNANDFGKLEKFSEFISSESQNNFTILFSKLKENFKKQSLLFFENIPNYSQETVKTYENDLKSGFYKYRTDKTFSLPKINTTTNSQDESEDLSTTEQNVDNSLGNDFLRKQKFASQWYEIGSLMNKLLTIILTDLRECKHSNKKLNQKMMEYEIRLANNNKEIENMKKFLNKYEVSSKIYLKIKNEKELDKVKASFNQKENKYILSIYKLEEEIKTLTSLLDNNQKYYHQCKDLQKEIEIGKKRNEELKFLFNQELHEKNMQKAIERENEEDLLQKMENLNEIIEDLKKEGDRRRKNDIENQIKIKKLNMTLDEKKENIVMLNEELEWYIRELNKTKNDLNISKIDLANLENVILNKIKEKEKHKKENKDNENNDKDNISNIANENENGNEIIKGKEGDESIQDNSNIFNYKNYSLDNEKDKDKSNSEIPALNLSLIIKNSPKS